MIHVYQLVHMYMYLILLLYSRIQRENWIDVLLMGQTGDDINKLVYT